MMTFNLHGIRKKNVVKSLINFKTNSATGYTPLLKLVPVISGGTDYFNAETRWVNRSVAGLLSMDVDRKIVSFRKFLRRSYSSNNNPLATIALSFFSVLGMRGDFDRTLSVGRLHGDTGDAMKMIIDNEVDVFVLPVIKTSDVPKIEITERQVRFDPKLVTLLVSPRFRDDYIPRNYNPTVAKYLRSELKRVSKLYGMEVKNVSDEEIASYTYNPFVIKTNSIFEIMEIDKQIKEKVYNEVVKNNKKLLPV